MTLQMQLEVPSSPHTSYSRPASVSVRKISSTFGMGYGGLMYYYYIEVRVGPVHFLYLR